MKTKLFRLGEMFCGPGGLALGAMRTKVENGSVTFGIKHSWAIDYDKVSCETYRNNICPDNPSSVICENIRTLDLNTLSPIDAFAYGFPCNDFSIVGEKRGIEGEFGPLYLYGIKVMNKLKPKFFIAENVGGLTSANEGQALKQILMNLENCGDGYNLTTHFYKFEEYGVPQARHRIIIVGLDKKLGLFFRPPKPFSQSTPVSARQALESPPIGDDAANHERTKQSKKVVERLQYIQPGQNAWNAELPSSLQLNVKGARLSQIYKRLDPDKPAYTITGSGGGGTHCYHWREPRALTNRERARLQTFPDDYIFCGSKESVRKQLGMAVPPKMSEVIFTAVLKTLAGINYPSLPLVEKQMALFKSDEILSLA